MIMETDQEYVLKRWPHASVVALNLGEMPYHPYVIVPGGQEFNGITVGANSDSIYFIIGGGNTEDEAWHNAAIHIRTAEKFKESRK